MSKLYEQLGEPRVFGQLADGIGRREAQRNRRHVIRETRLERLLHADPIAEPEMHAERPKRRNVLSGGRALCELLEHTFSRPAIAGSAVRVPEHRGVLHAATRHGDALLESVESLLVSAEATERGPAHEEREGKIALEFHRRRAGDQGTFELALNEQTQALERREERREGIELSSPCRVLASFLPAPAPNPWAPKIGTSGRPSASAVASWSSVNRMFDEVEEPVMNEPSIPTKGEISGQPAPALAAAAAAR